MNKRKWQILIPDAPHKSSKVEQDVFGAKGKIIQRQETNPKNIEDEIWESTDAILIWHFMNLDRQTIKKLKRCKIIVRIGAGFDSVDIDAAGEKGIFVCNVPDYGTEDVADHAIALLLSLFRGIVGYDISVRSGNWQWEAMRPLKRVTGKTLGIIGLGRIGTAVAVRAKALGMMVVFYDPYKEDGYDKALGIKRLQHLDELLEMSDAVSIHTPLTNETRGMVNNKFFNTLKQDAIFVNTARGGIVNLDSLETALRSRRLLGAGLDVLPVEPPDINHPLIASWRSMESWLMGRLIITPHAAFYNEESFTEMREKAAIAALKVLNGDKPKNCINQQFIQIIK